jgi:hypothetical protein
MIPDEIRQRLTATTFVLNPSAFIFGTMPLLAVQSIGRVLRDEPRMVELRRFG